MAASNGENAGNQCLISYADWQEASPEVREAAQTLPFERNIFRILGHSTVAFPPFMKLLASLWKPERKIRSTDWQLVVLRTAATLDAPYEWDVNEPVGRIFGFGDEQLAALHDAQHPLPEHLFSPRRRIISRLVEELSSSNKASEDTMAEMKKIFSDEEIVELFYVHGLYAMLARMMNSCHIDLDPPIPGLEDMLRKFNAAAIEREKQYED